MLESNCMSSLKYFVVVDSIDIADDLKSRSIVVAEMPGHLIIFKSDSASSTVVPLSPKLIRQGSMEASFRSSD